MLTDREKDVSQDIFEAESNLVKVRVLLNDLLEDYLFDGDKPDEETVRNLAYEARRVLTFIRMINDYAFDIKKNLDQAQGRLS